jgi:hypothetical protein
MWNFFRPFYETPEKARKAIRRYRALGCNSGTMMSSMIDHDAFLASMKAFGLRFGYKGLKTEGAFPFKENGFPYYLMNVLRPIYWDWNDAKPKFRRMYEQFDKVRDRSVFVRVPCVNDPQVIETMEWHTRHILEILRDEDALGLCHYYDLRDEPSVTSFVLASDVCFCEHCMARMRDWLKDTYGGLRELNAAWETRFRSWNDVAPLTSQEMLERREAGHFNFAPWADHRTFQNDSFLRTLERGKETIKEYDPDAPVGICGTQCPSVFGGYDFSKLGPAMEFVEAYDFGCSVHLWRSLRRDPSVPIMMTSFWSPDRAPMLEARLWKYVYQGGGHSGTIIWESNALFDPKSEDVKPLDGTRAFGEVLAELRAGAPRLLQRSRDQSSPVAVHYSHASVNADFALSCPNRPHSIAAWEDDKGALYPTRDAWFTLLEDLGLRPVFLSSQQIEAGELERRKIKLLVLPRSVAISDKEARRMRAFVRAGGVLAADSFPGRMDEHCRDRQTGCLDSLLGIRRLDRDDYFCAVENVNWLRDWTGKDFGGRRRFDVGHVENLIRPRKGTVAMGRTEVADSPIGIVREVGEGRTVLFNATPLHYNLVRTKGTGKMMRDFFGSCVRMARVKPELLITRPGSGEPMPGFGVFPFRHGRNRYFGLAPDMGITQDVLGGMTVDGHVRGGSVTVRFPVSGHIYDVRRGKYLGKGDEIPAGLDTYSAPLYAVTKTKARKMSLTFDGGKASARLTVTGGSPGERVFRFDLHNSRGKRLLDAGANVVARGGKATWTPDTKLPKNGALVCRDVATGVRAEVKRNA